MGLPQVAIVGRPNVGKSSLLNRLARRRVSIVDPTPGVTRDRVSTILEIDAPTDTPKGTPARLVEVIDTGGYGVYTAEGKRFDEAGIDLSVLTPEIEAQIRLARERAQLVLLVVDAQASITALDETIARLLREEGSAERVLVVANKVDGEEWVAHGLEAAAFGLGEPICVSAANGFGMRALLDALWERIEETEAEIEAEPEMKLAIVGKRNAGKSTLINAWAGEERVIVSEVPGTTRDSVDVRFEIEGRAMIAIDTAGVRKRKSFADDIEYYAYHRMLNSIRRADVVLLLIDASLEVSQVDKKLAQELQRQYKPTVIVVSKWDLVDESKTSPEDYLEYLTEQLRGLDFAPIVFISAREGEGLASLAAMAFNLYEQAGHRESTGRLNRVVEEILRKRGPSSRLGTQAKLFYASQIDVHPPTIVLKVNQPKLFEGRYERYLLNRLREELPFSEVPIRLLFSERTRDSLEEMKRRGRSGPPSLDDD
jgi:GTP-binding protein